MGRDVKWSSNSLMKPPELKPRVINIDWGLHRSEHVLGLSASLSTQTGGLGKYASKALHQETSRVPMFQLPLDDASTPLEVSGDW